jgi:predicted MFS family arabinose efflux permease
MAGISRPVELTRASGPYRVAIRWEERMRRIVLAIVLGAAVGGLFLWLGFWASGYLFPPSPAIDLKPELARTMKNGVPILNFLMKLVACGVCGFIGAGLAGRFAQQGAWPAWTAAGMMIVGMLAFSLAPQNPLWFLFLGALFIGAGGFMAGRLSPYGPPDYAEA